VVTAPAQGLCLERIFYELASGLGGAGGVGGAGGECAGESEIVAVAEEATEVAELRAGLALLQATSLGSRMAEATPVPGWPSSGDGEVGA